MKILSLGQTIAFSHKSKQFVSCFAGYSFDLCELIRIFPCEPELRLNHIYDLDVQKSLDKRHESYCLNSLQIGRGVKNDYIETLDLLESLSQTFEEVFESESTLGVVSLSSYTYRYGDKQSIVTMEDLELGQFTANIFQIGLTSKSFSTNWNNSGSDKTYALIGNKKSNGVWIAINLVSEKVLTTFDKVEYQRNLMRKRRETQISISEPARIETS